MHFQNNFNCYFTPYYSDGIIDYFVKRGLLNFTVLGGVFRKATEDYLVLNQLKVDYKGLERSYDLVVTCSDLIIPKNIKGKKIVLVQEGMTDKENIFFYLAKHLKFPRWLASTSTTGMSDEYSAFCVASEGYKEHFIRKGCNPSKIFVTGIPNFDNCETYRTNKFSHKQYVLVCTSDSRETFKYENRKNFLKKALKIAGNRLVIFKLHPNENFEKAIIEIKRYAKGSMIFTEGDTNEMIANCDVLITRYSTVVYVGLALGKEVYSEFNLEVLKKMTPIQNGGMSAQNISTVCKKVLISEPEFYAEQKHSTNYQQPVFEY